MAPCGGDAERSIQAGPGGRDLQRVEVWAGRTTRGAPRGRKFQIRVVSGKVRPRRVRPSVCGRGGGTRQVKFYSKVSSFLRTSTVAVIHATRIGDGEHCERMKTGIKWDSLCWSKLGLKCRTRTLDK